MGLSFKKELTLADEQVYPPNQYPKKSTTRLQEKLITKLGQTSFPFELNFPRHSPTSVSLLPSMDEMVIHISKLKVSAGKNGIIRH